MAAKKRYPGVAKTANGRYRAVLCVAGKNISVATLLGQKGTTWATPLEAFQARCDAELRLQQKVVQSKTIAAWWEIWTTDPIWGRPSESTNIHYRERSRAFVEKYGHIPLSDLDERRGLSTYGGEIVREWRSIAGNVSTLPVLRTMFNDAMTEDAGRLLARNPFAGLRAVKASHGTGSDLENVPPPSAELLERMIEAARALNPSFAMWLKFASATGMRPGEIDALCWEEDPDRGMIQTFLVADRNRIRVGAQFNTKSNKFTLPKHQTRPREAIYTPRAREAVAEVREYGFESPFVFPTLRDTHWRASSRSWPWTAVRATVGWNGDGQRLYLATRHYAGRYMYRDLELPARQVAAALGHNDNGALVERVYGHYDDATALARAEERIEDAYVAERRKQIRVA